MVLEGVPYGQNGQRMDIYLPEGRRNGCAIFFIHGGGWCGGDRKGWASVAGHFAGQGYVCASADYRLLPQWTMPHQVADVRLAMSVFRSLAGQHGFRPDRIAAAGSSAGGHLAAMLATLGPQDDLGATPDMPLRDTRPNALVCYCSVLSLHARDQTGLGGAIAQFLGASEGQRGDLYRQASPIDRVCGREPPVLLIHGQADETVPLAQSQAMRQALQAVGVPAHLAVIPGAAHGFGYGVSSEHQKIALGHFEEFLAECFMPSLTQSS